MDRPITQGVHHLALGARDAEAVALFYERALGLTRTRVHHEPTGALRSIWLLLDSERPDAGVLMVESTLDPSPARPPAQVSPGWFLCTFAVRFSDRGTVEALIEDAGGLIEFRSEYSTYCRDPENNRFAVSCYPL